MDVRVCAPGSIPRAPGDRVKTDRRDAERLARLLLAGELSFVRVPTPEEERFRDLTRCREAARADLMRACHRVTKFLLRRELRWEGSACAWTQAHWKWLDGIEFSDGPSSAVLADYLCAERALEQRRGVAERAIEDSWPESPRPGTDRAARRRASARAGSEGSPRCGAVANESEAPGRHPSPVRVGSRQRYPILWSGGRIGDVIAAKSQRLTPGGLLGPGEVGR